MYYEGFKGEAIQLLNENTVETVVLLSKGMVDTRKVKVDFSLANMDLSEFKGAKGPGELCLARTEAETAIVYTGDERCDYAGIY